MEMEQTTIRDNDVINEDPPTTPMIEGGGEVNDTDSKIKSRRKKRCTVGFILGAIVKGFIIGIAIYFLRNHSKEDDPTNSDPTNGDPTNGDPTSGDPTDGDPTKGDPKDGDPTKGDPTNGDHTKGDSTDGDPTKGDSTIGGSSCVQELDDTTWPKYPAIIFDTETQDPVLPKKSASGRNLSFRDGSEVLLACPGTKLAFNGETLGKLQCSDGTLTIDKKVVELSDLGCVKAPKENINKGGDCGEGGILYTIGWSITADIFEPQVDVCFHEDKETTSYTYHKVYGKSMDAKTIDPKRPGFKSAKYFSVSMTKAYSQKFQKTLFTTLFGSDEAIDVKKQNYFAKGHLAPDSDFVYGYQQDATYYFLNAVPQWQAFNNGNWKALEFSVRDLAVMHDRDLQVWTGATGTLSMPDKNNNAVEIMLGQSYNKDLIPAPALMWKAVYEKSTDSGVAFVGVNNPYATELTDDLRICQDMCDQVSWMDWPRDDWKHGYMYCCTLDDLQKALPANLVLPKKAKLLAN